jgi:hypothetical protein
VSDLGHVESPGKLMHIVEAVVLVVTVVVLVVIDSAAIVFNHRVILSLIGLCSHAITVIPVILDTSWLRIFRIHWLSIWVRTIVGTILSEGR